MIIQRIIVRQLVLLSLLFCSALSASEQRYYRYINLEGNVVIDHRVPTDYAGHGYQVINAKGAVLEDVPRLLSADERAARVAQTIEEEQVRAAQQQAQKRDSNLLLRYSSVEDIEAAKARALRDLRIRISILQGKLRSLKQKIEASQVQAADLERQGREVDSALLKVMDDLRHELRSTEQNIASRKEEVAKVAAEYDSDIKRFEELLVLVELRRRKERGQLTER